MNKTKAIRNTVLSFTALAAVVSLSACSSAKDQLGLTRQAPDEFAVVKRAPLAMPPDYSLRPPRPGAPRPQETATSEKAREVVFGEESDTAKAAEIDTAEDYLLQKTGATDVPSDIREVVDAETRARAPREKPVAERLLGWGSEEPPAADVVNAKAEAERLRKNKATGQPVTEGETPSIEE